MIMNEFYSMTIRLVEGQNVHQTDKFFKKIVHALHAQIILKLHLVVRIVSQIYVIRGKPLMYLENVITVKNIPEHKETV